MSLSIRTDRSGKTSFDSNQTASSVKTLIRLPFCLYLLVKPNSSNFRITTACLGCPKFFLKFCGSHLFSQTGCYINFDNQAFRRNKYTDQHICLFLHFSNFRRLQIF